MSCWQAGSDRPPRTPWLPLPSPTAILGTLALVARVAHALRTARTAARRGDENGARA